MSAGSGQARNALRELRRAGGGSVRLLDEAEWERLEAYVRWLYRRTDSLKRWKSYGEANEVFSDVAGGWDIGSRRQLRRERADRYYTELGGEKLTKDLVAAKRLWLLCYQFVLVWEETRGANALYTRPATPGVP